jgi:tetratricopeptide (TPR) repeat protein
MDAKAQAQAALERGERARRAQRLPEALAAFTEAVAALRPADQAAELAHALTRQAQIHRDLHDDDAAEPPQAEAVAIYRRLGDNRGLADALRHLGDILGEAGRGEAAAPLMDEMLALRSAAVHAGRIGDRQAARDLWREARDRYAALDEVFRQLTGRDINPGVEESDRRLAAMSAE